MRVISLGWGTQSFGLAAMSALGVLPPVDVAIHADTTHERSETYKFAARWTPWLEERGVRVVTVRPQRCTSPVVNDWGGVFIPAYTLTPSAGGGQLRRQCTGDWKIRPIRRWLQAHRNGAQVEMWLGITLDEMRRMKPANVKYITHRWPFLEREHWSGRMMLRSDVVAWLRRNLGDDAVPPRSACYFCPYHSRAEWRDLRDNGNGDWQRAVDFDLAIRKLRPPYDLFVCAERVPLTDLDLSTPADRGQLPLWENECTGICGL